MVKLLVPGLQTALQNHKTSLSLRQIPANQVIAVEALPTLLDGEVGDTGLEHMPSRGLTE